MASGRGTIFLAEISTPHSDSPAYRTCPIMASTIEEASRKASSWATCVLASLAQTHHLRLVQDDVVIWTRTYGKPRHS